MSWKQMIAADENGMSFLRQDYIWPDTLHHVNSQGFLSRYDYKREVVDSLHREGKLVLFVIGDSFVEGFASSSRDHSFCQLMTKDLKDQYLIFGFDIAGTDPLEYKLRVEKFVSS